MANTKQAKLNNKYLLYKGAKTLWDSSLALFILSYILFIGAFILSLVILISFQMNLVEYAEGWEYKIGLPISQWTSFNYSDAYKYWLVDFDNINMLWMQRCGIGALMLGSLITIALASVNINISYKMMQLLDNGKSNVRILHHSIFGISITQILIAVGILTPMITFLAIVDLIQADNFVIYTQYILTGISAAGMLIVILEAAEFACGLNQNIRIKNGAR